jgi:nitrogen fixation protein NifX
MRIAAVSTDGKNVNDHFGKAEEFLIFDVTEKGPDFVAARQSVPLSVNAPDHPFDATRFGKIVDVIRDCQAVYVTCIGDVPAAELKKHGIEPRIFTGSIKDIPA